VRVEQIANEALAVELLPEAGGRLHRLRVFGQDVLRTPPDPAEHLRDPFHWGAFPLVPWSNRVPDGRIDRPGRLARLPCNDGRFAIHGEAYLRPWQVAGPGALAFRGGQHGFPWPYGATLNVALDGRTLTLTLAVSNAGEIDAPLGLGIHPWFDATGGLEVALPAELAYPQTDHLPSGEPRPVSGPLDRRALSPVPWGTDNVWTGLSARAIELRWPGKQLSARFGFSAAATHVVMAAFAAQNAVAIEPVTHAPDGFHLLNEQRRGAVALVAPGATLAVAYTLSFALF
jgi:aldose 1-epimerase